MNGAPSLLGLKPSFGFGDRLGLAGNGHVRAARKGPYAPVFAQQSAREIARTRRTPEETLAAAREAVQKERWGEPWGADADHLKTRGDVFQWAKAGYTFFTIDPSEEVDKPPSPEAVKMYESLYLGTTRELDEFAVTFDRESLSKAVRKYGRALDRAEQTARWIAEAAPEHEIEISVDETDEPTTPLEHLFIGLELKRRGVQIVSLAPRYVGSFEKGIDYKGCLKTFEASLRKHAALARACGPYKLSVHSGSDKFALYPIIGRVCGDLLHVKTAGTSYLEALRVAARQNAPLFREIAEFALTRFETDRATYHISADLRRVPKPADLSETARETAFLDDNDGRQVLHVTFGSVLADPQNRFKDRLMETLHAHAELHASLLEAHLGRHIEGLQAG